MITSKHVLSGYYCFRRLCDQIYNNYSEENPLPAHDVEAMRELIPVQLPPTVP